jgi:hypothetical protein
MTLQLQSTQYVKQPVAGLDVVADHASVVTVQRDGRRLLGKSVEGYESVRSCPETFPSGMRPRLMRKPPHIWCRTLIGVQ